MEDTRKKLGAGRYRDIFPGSTQARTVQHSRRFWKHGRIRDCIYDCAASGNIQNCEQNCSSPVVSCNNHDHNHSPSIISHPSPVHDMSDAICCSAVLQSNERNVWLNYITPNGIKGITRVQRKDKITEEAARPVALFLGHSHHTSIWSKIIAFSSSSSPAVSPSYGPSSLLPETRTPVSGLMLSVMVMPVTLAYYDQPE